MQFDAADRARREPPEQSLGVVRPTEGQLQRDHARSLRLICQGGLNELIFNFVVEGSGLDLTYAALAHPVRRDLLERLRSAPQKVTALAAPFDISLAAVSKHLSALEHAGLVTRSVHGREHVLAAAPAGLDGAYSWITRYRSFWEATLDALDVHLREQEAP